MRPCINERISWANRSESASSAQDLPRSFILRAIARLRRDFQVAAICGRNAVAARGIAERYGVPQSFDSVEAMLRDPGIDVIDICIPNHLHVPLIIEAASHDKHIICEKPLGGYFGPPGAHDSWCARGASRQNMLESIAEQAGAVRSAIERAGVTFCYGENWVYAPPIAKVDRLLAASSSTIMRIEAENHTPARTAATRCGGGPPAAARSSGWERIRSVPRCISSIRKGSAARQADPPDLSARAGRQPDETSNPFATSRGSM